ncbi:TerB family tellurite resistance protein [Deltaproteobacteria bacterium]|nr:TerB family tellurite resistance protein [Deltaproteobacteria bacterium]
MIDMVKKLFSRETSDDSLENVKDPAESIYLATCAILLELASIDGEFSDAEKDNIISLFKRDYNLADEDIAALMEASEKELRDSIDLWQFTNLINQNCSLEQKVQIVETVWKVAYADGTLDQHEDYLAHKVATLLRLNHKQLIDSKLKVLHGSEPQKGLN